MKKIENLPENTKIVLFTGGRDSTLTASYLMLKGFPVFLLSADSGASVHRGITKYRIKELKKRFGNLVTGNLTIDVAGSFRKIALRDIEQDILTDHKNLVVLGEKIAILAHTVDFCRRNKLFDVSLGYAKYQQEFPEQRDVSRERLQQLLAGYDINCTYPIYDLCEKIEDVKYRLMEIGLSNKPLEGSTLFGDTFSKASDDVIGSYIERKVGLFHEQIKFLGAEELLL